MGTEERGGGGWTDAREIWSGSGSHGSGEEGRGGEKKRRGAREGGSEERENRGGDGRCELKAKKRETEEEEGKVRGSLGSAGTKEAGSLSSFLDS